MEKLSTSERVQLMKKQLGDVTNVKIATLSGASKSVVGQWISGEIKEIAPRYAYRLEEKTKFLAKWIMLGEGPHTRDIKVEEPLFLEGGAQSAPIELSKDDYTRISDKEGQSKKAEAATYSEAVQAVLDLMLALSEAKQGFIHRAAVEAMKDLKPIEKDKEQKVAGQTGN